MESECLMINCRNLAPDDQAFCAKHRDTRDRKLEDIPHAELLARLAVANEVIAEQLEVRKRLEGELIATRETAIKQRDAEIAAWLREHAPQWGHEALADAIERREVGDAE